MLVLRLTPLAVDHVRGIYTVGGVAGRMPDRMRWLSPAAAADFAPIAGKVVVSDMFRSPEASLRAVREGRGAQPPGWSAHNYGEGIDLDIGDTMKRWGLKTKRELDEAMEAHGWFCHRRDHAMEFEAWHFNHLGRGAKASGKRTSDEVEAHLQALYGDQLAPDDLEAQRMLQKLRLYGGALDGDVGPLTRQATEVFQKAWGRPPTGELDVRTRRTLAYVSADREVVVEAPPAAA